MPVTLEIVINKKQLAEITELLAEVPRGVPKVLTRAINKVGVAARTHIIRRIVARLNLKTRDVRNRNVFLYKANYANLMARINISGRRIPLMRWGARQLKRGVSYAIRKGQRKRLEGAFIQQMTSGHRGVFMRSGEFQRSKIAARKTSKRLGRRKGKGFMVRPRLPIAERYGPSVPEAAKNIRELSQRVLDEKIATDLAGEVETQVGLVLERHRSRAAARAIEAAAEAVAEAVA